MEATLQERVASLPWHHQIDLGGGVVTHGADQSAVKMKALHLPDAMHGLRVLDIGAWDGFFSFACEKRGASVVASDHFCWGGSGLYDKRPFDLAKTALRSKVEEKFIRVEDISPDTMNGFFDIVLFLGVLYHAPDPLGYLKRVRSVIKPGGFAVIETHVDLTEVNRPAIAYYPADTFGGRHTKLFGPNPLAVQGMCFDAGFSRTVLVDNDFHGPTRAVFHAFP